VERPKPPSRHRKEQRPLSVKNKTRLAHVVQRGEALSTIAERYGVRVVDLRNWNDISYKSKIFAGETLYVWIETAKSVSPSVKQRSDSRRWISYRVKEGDTLEKIALIHGVEIDDVRRWNDLRSDRILVGQTLSIQLEEATGASNRGTASVTLSGSQHGKSIIRMEKRERRADASRNVVVYRIKRGDSLHKIAAAFGTTVSQIKTWNNLRTNTIRAGDELIIYVDDARASESGVSG